MSRIGEAVRWRKHLALIRLAGGELRLSGTTPSVALTFDDGPDPESTPAVLDILDAHGVPATFFCVGYRARRHPDLVRRIITAGHAVGSHSETHRVTDLSPADAAADYEAGRRSLEEVLGRPVPLFRPPHGRLDVGTARALRQGRYRSWWWTVDTADYAPGTTSAAATTTLAACAPRDVVLMHDGLEEGEPGAPPRSMLGEYLPPAITSVQARGLTFVTLG